MGVVPGPIRRVRSGENVSASHWNMAIDAINQLKNLGVGHGLEILKTDTGIQINLARPPFARVAARIQVASATGTGIASAGTYDVTAIDRPDIPVLTGMTPKYGRPTRNDEIHIYYAATDDLCYLVPRASGDGFGYDLEVITEVAHWLDCADLNQP